MNQQSKIWINVFTNKNDNPNAPIERVIVKFPDGTELEGGLWEKVSSKGTAYKAGELKKPSDQKQYARREPSAPRQAPGRAAQASSDPVDW